MSNEDATLDRAAQLQGWCDAMVARDIERVMAYCHPNIHLAMLFGEVPLPFIGTTDGIEAARRRTVLVFNSWQFSDPEFSINEITPLDARAWLRMTVIHRWTGMSTPVAIRQVFAFENGLIRSFRGYLDAPRFTAFLHHVGLAPSKRGNR